MVGNGSDQDEKLKSWEQETINEYEAPWKKNNPGIFAAKVLELKYLKVVGILVQM